MGSLVALYMGNSHAIDLGNRASLSPTLARHAATLVAMNRAPETTEPDLAKLLQAVANKDRSAFAEFYDLTVDRVLSLVLRITQQVEIAEEVAGDVFLQVWRQADRFDPRRGNAFAWLTVLSRSRALDAVRKNKAIPTHGALSLDEAPEPQTTELSQDLLQAVEQRSGLHAALEKLTSEQRQLLALAYFRGHSHSELAQFTGLPLGTVKTQLRRAIIKLKDLMVASETEGRSAT